jgi:hypothetical protein
MKLVGKLTKEELERRIADGTDERTTTMTRTISLYEDNAGHLAIYDSQRDAYITGLEGVDSSFADDAASLDAWWDEWAGQEGWFGGNPETESETHLVAFYENGAVVTVDHGTAGTAARRYLSTDQ